MVWCRVEVERRRDFAYYAAQFPSLRLNLLEEDEDAWQQRLYSKYGKPYQLRSQLREVEQLLEQMESVCGQQDRLRGEIKQLKEQGRTGTVTPALLRSQLDCTQKLRWITAKTKEIQQLRWQLDAALRSWNNRRTSKRRDEPWQKTRPLPPTGRCWNWPSR